MSKIDIDPVTRISDFLQQAEWRVQNLTEDALWLLESDRPRIESAYLLTIHAQELLGKMLIEAWKHRLKLTDADSLMPTKVPGRSHKSKIAAYHCIELAIMQGKPIQIAGSGNPNWHETPEGRAAISVAMQAFEKWRVDMDRAQEGVTEKIRQSLLYVDIDEKWNRERPNITAQDVRNAISLVRGCLMGSKIEVANQHALMNYRVAMHERRIKINDLVFGSVIEMI
jgi:AbiV family abortive infection protein